MKRWLCILDPLGKVLAIYACTMFVPGIIGAVMGEEIFAFKQGGIAKYFLTGGIALAIGLLAAWAGSGYARYLRTRQAFLLVLIIWFLLPLIGAIPLADFTDTFSEAYFEAVSGMTASGATVLSGIDDFPVAVKLWRGLISWMGGMGLIVLAVAILPYLGVGGRQLFKNEMPGPVKEQDLSPQITETAKGLWGVYFVLTLACALAYAAGGMSWLDAVVHAFTTMSLGGFSNHDASFGFFNSPLLEGIAVVFMIIAGMNFATHYSCIRSIGAGAGNGRRYSLLRRLGNMFARAGSTFRSTYRADFECQAYLSVLVIGVVLVVAILLTSSHYDNYWNAIRHGIFNTVAIATTTGYSSADFNGWPLIAPLLMLLLANFTSCGGSTGGGIKMMRAITLFKVTSAEQLKLLHSHATYNIKIGLRIMPDGIVSSILFFVLAYFASILLFAMLFVITENYTPADMLTALSASIALVSNTGPGLGAVGPYANYSGLSEAGTWLGAIAMLLGRLELLVFLLLFRRDLWSH